MKPKANHVNKMLLAILAILFPLFANAEKVQIGGIWYNLIEKAKQAVVAHEDEAYGDSIFVVPSIITHNGETYNVSEVKRLYLRSSNSISVILSEGITHIGEDAFVACCLTEITIPKSIVSIGKSAFRFCAGLTSISIPEGIQNIEELTFCYSGLSSITLPQSLKSIGEKAFYGCSKLTEITIPNNVFLIRSGAFEDCSNLKVVNFPEKLNTISESVFEGCTSLVNIELPKQLSSIYNGAFRGCTNLSSIEIPNNVSRINDFAFEGCTNLTNIKIPENISSIGRYAFNGCVNISSIVIPARVRSIEYKSFEGCSSLDTLVIQGMPIIDDYAFSECPKMLDVFCLSEKVISAVDRELHEDYNLDVDALVAEEHAFFNSDIKYATLHVPSGSERSYRNWSPWNKFGKIVSLTEGDLEKFYGHPQKDFPYLVLPIIVGLIFIIILIAMRPKKKTNTEGL